MPSEADAILLCGGAGLRLRSITRGGPKALASIRGRPFLELLLNQLRRHGFTRVILAVGYQGELIRSHFGERFHGLELRYAEEPSPLGTGGALRNTANLMESEASLIMNGDSYTDADLPAFVADYRELKADVSVLVVPADGRTDCGLVSVDSNRRVIGFREKRGASGLQYVNAGIYIASNSILCDAPPGVRMSLEEELFPRWLADGKNVRSFMHRGSCVDIGTPERFQSAQDVLAGAEVDGTVLPDESQQE